MMRGVLLVPLLGLGSTLMPSPQPVHLTGQNHIPLTTVTLRNGATVHIDSVVDWPPDRPAEAGRAPRREIFLDVTSPRDDGVEPGVKMVVRLPAPEQAVFEEIQPPCFRPNGAWRIGHTVANPAAGKRVKLEVGISVGAWKTVWSTPVSQSGFGNHVPANVSPAMGFESGPPPGGPMFAVNIRVPRNVADLEYRVVGYGPKGIVYPLNARRRTTNFIFKGALRDYRRIEFQTRPFEFTTFGEVAIG